MKKKGIAMKLKDIVRDRSDLKIDGEFCVQNRKNSNLGKLQAKVCSFFNVYKKYQSTVLIDCFQHFSNKNSIKDNSNWFYFYISQMCFLI